MSFDEWMNKNHGGRFDMPHQRDCYEAGAASRQAEIDELQNRIDEALDSLHASNHYDEYYVSQAIKILKGEKQ